MIDNTVKTRIKSNTTYREATVSKDTGAIFSILTESVYSSPRMAGIREIISNGIDATTRAKLNRPIEIKIPSAIDTSFSVRNYGYGLSDEEIYSLYTSLGSSSKKDVEDEIGFFGIGALSPLAYVESFTVQAYQDGLTRIYSIFTGEKGVPQVAFLGETKTDQENGMRVSYNVRREEISKFKNDVISTLEFIDPSKFQCGEKIVFFKDQIKSSNDLVMNFDDKIFIRSKPYYSNLAQNMLVMGGVSYEFNPSFIQKDLFNRFTVVIDAPIGAVSVQASREKLKMNAKTIAYLTEIIEFIYKNLKDEVQKQIDAADNFIEACKIQNRMTIIKLSKMKWKNITLDFEDFLKKCEDYFTVKIKAGKQFFSLDAAKHNYKRRTSEVTRIFLDNTTRGGLTRIKDNSNRDCCIVLIQTSSEKTQEFFKIYGTIPVELASKLPAPAAKQKSVGRVKAKTYTITTKRSPYNPNSTNCLDEFTEDYDKFDGFYVVCKNRSIIYGERKISIADIYHAKELANGKEILVIDWEAEKPPKAKCFLDHVAKNAGNIISKYYKNYYLHKLSNSQKFSFLIKTRKDLNKEYKDLFDGFLKMKISEIINLANAIGVAIPDIADKFNYEEKLNKVIDKHYPIFNMLDYRAFIYGNDKHIASYLLSGDQDVFKGVLN